MNTLKTSLLTLAMLMSGSIMSQNHISYGSQQSIDFKYLKGERRILQTEGKSVAYRAFEGMSYVVNPVDKSCQTVNIYIPEAYYSGGSVNGYKSETAPIFMPIADASASVSAQKLDGDFYPCAKEALAEGYIVACPGYRVESKMPSSIVDLKAVVRYLKYNDDDMPGDAEKIVAAGRGKGGGLAVLLGASGLSSDYDQYLDKLGATRSDDDVYAVAAFAPETMANHADAACKWQKRSLSDYSEFAEYINSMELKDNDGSPLGLAKNGDGSFLRAVEALFVNSAQQAVSSGCKFDGQSYVTISGGKVQGLNLAEYTKTLGLGNAVQSVADVDASPLLIRMMTPTTYIGNTDVELAKHWLMYQGSADAVVPCAIPFILTRKLNAMGRKVDFRLCWGVGHDALWKSSDVFDWLSNICR